MSELAPVESTETFKPARSLELVENEDPTELRIEDGEQTSRFKDIDEAHDVANLINVQSDMLNEARADLEQAYAKKDSPLVESYQNKVNFAEMGLNQELKAVPRAQRLEEAAKKRESESYEKAA